MQIISEADVTLTRLRQLFLGVADSACIVDVYPAAPNMNLPGDAYLALKFASDEVVIWLDQQAKFLLRFRVIVVARDRACQISDDERLEEGAFLNQQASCFASIATENLLGIALEYPLPFKNGILDETILSVTRELLAGAAKARAHFQKVELYKS